MRSLLNDVGRVGHPLHYYLSTDQVRQLFKHSLPTSGMPEKVALRTPERKHETVRERERRLRA